MIDRCDFCFHVIPDDERVTACPGCGLDVSFALGDDDLYEPTRKQTPEEKQATKAHIRRLRTWRTKRRRAKAAGRVFTTPRPRLPAAIARGETA